MNEFISYYYINRAFFGISLVILPPYEYFGDIPEEHNIVDTANTHITQTLQRSIIGCKNSIL